MPSLHSLVELSECDGTPRPQAGETEAEVTPHTRQAPVRSTWEALGSNLRERFPTTRSNGTEMDTSTCIKNSKPPEFQEGNSERGREIHPTLIRRMTSDCSTREIGRAPGI